MCRLILVHTFWYTVQVFCDCFFPWLGKVATRAIVQLVGFLQYFLIILVQACPRFVLSAM